MSVALDPPEWMPRPLACVLRALYFNALDPADDFSTAARKAFMAGIFPIAVCIPIGGTIMAINDGLRVSTSVVIAAQVVLFSVVPVFVWMRVTRSLSERLSAAVFVAVGITTSLMCVCAPQLAPYTVVSTIIAFVVALLSPSLYHVQDIVWLVALGISLYNDMTLKSETSVRLHDTGNTFGSASPTPAPAAGGVYNGSDATSGTLIRNDGGVDAYAGGGCSYNCWANISDQITDPAPLLLPEPLLIPFAQRVIPAVVAWVVVVLVLILGRTTAASFRRQLSMERRSASLASVVATSLSRYDTETARQLLLAASWPTSPKRRGPAGTFGDDDNASGGEGEGEPHSALPSQRNRRGAPSRATSRKHGRRAQRAAYAMNEGDVVLHHQHHDGMPSGTLDGLGGEVDGSGFESIRGADPQLVSSLALIVSNLEQFRPFLPNWVLDQTTASAGAHPAAPAALHDFDAHGLASARRSIASSMSTSAATAFTMTAGANRSVGVLDDDDNGDALSASSRRAARATHRRADVPPSAAAILRQPRGVNHELRQAYISRALVDVRLSASAHRALGKSLTDSINAVVDAIFAAARSTGGAVHSFIGDVVDVSWNAASVVASPEAKAARFLARTRRHIAAIRATLGHPEHGSSSQGAGMLMLSQQQQHHQSSQQSQQPPPFGLPLVGGVPESPAAPQPTFTLPSFGAVSEQPISVAAAATCGQARILIAGSMARKGLFVSPSISAARTLTAFVLMSRRHGVFITDEACAREAVDVVTAGVAAISIDPKAAGVPAPAHGPGSHSHAPSPSGGPNGMFTERANRSYSRHGISLPHAPVSTFTHKRTPTPPTTMSANVAGVSGPSPNLLTVDHGHSIVTENLEPDEHPDPLGAAYAPPQPPPPPAASQTGGSGSSQASQQGAHAGVHQHPLGKSASMNGAVSRTAHGIMHARRPTAPGPASRQASSASLLDGLAEEPEVASPLSTKDDALLRQQDSGASNPPQPTEPLTNARMSATDDMRRTPGGSSAGHTAAPLTGSHNYQQQPPQQRQQSTASPMVAALRVFEVLHESTLDSWLYAPSQPHRGRSSASAGGSFDVPQDDLNPAALESPRAAALRDQTTDERIASCTAEALEEAVAGRYHAAYTLLRRLVLAPASTHTTGDGSRPHPSSPTHDDWGLRDPCAFGQAVGEACGSQLAAQMAARCATLAARRADGDSGWAFVTRGSDLHASALY